MANIFEISRVTPVQWYRQSDTWNMTQATAYGTLGVFNLNFNNRHFDIDFWERNIDEWTAKQCYVQPFQTGDTIREQFVGIEQTGSVDYVIRLCTYSGEVIKSTAAIQGDQIGSTSQYIWEYEMYLWDVPEGEYHLQFWHKPNTSTGPNLFLISAPISIKHLHKGTSLFFYSNSFNDQDVFFETGVKFEIRVECKIMNFEPVSVKNTFNDEPYNLTLISANTHREWTVSFRDLPDYMIDKMSRVFDCNELTIDGIEYTSPEGSKLDIDRQKNQALSNAKITVWEKQNSPTLIVDANHEIICCDAPVTRRFYVDSYTIPSLTVTNVIRQHFDGVESFLSYLNNVVLVGIGQEACFTINANNEVVLKTSDDTLYAIFEALTINTILPYWLEIHMNDGFDVEFDSTFTAATKHVIDYGLGGSLSTAIATSITFSNTYPVGKKLYLFFTDLLTIDFTPTVLGSIKTIDGQLSPSFAEFYLQTQGVREILGNLFEFVDGTLNYVELGGNSFDTHNVNQQIMWYYDDYNNGAFDGSSTISLNSQTPSAPPTSESGINMMLSTLRHNGVTINTD